MNENTVEMTVGGTAYMLKQRLGWFEQAEVDGKAFRMFTDGGALVRAGDDISEIERIEIVINTAAHDLARLTARLVGVNRNQIKDLDPAHVPALIRRIGELEQEQAAEVAELQSENPTT